MTEENSEMLDPMQRLWQIASMLDAHFTQEDYELENPEELTDEATTLIGQEIESRSDARERIEMALESLASGSPFQTTELQLKQAYDALSTDEDEEYHFRNGRLKNE